jgi:hypothetical protein
VTSALDAFTGPRAGCLDTAALILKIFLSSAAASRRHGTGLSGSLTLCRWWCAPHAVVRLLCTRRPTPKEYHSWARAPVPEAEPTAFGGGKEAHCIRRWRAPVADWSAAFGGVEKMYCRRRWHAPHAAVRLLRTRRPMPREYDPWALAPVQEAGPPKRALGEIFSSVPGRQWGNPSLKRDSPEHGSHSHRSQRPFTLEFSVLSCRRSHHGLARSSRAPPARGGIQLGAHPARMGSVDVRWKDPCRCLSSRRPRRRRVCVLRLQTPQRFGAADPVFLRAAAGEAWPPTSTHYALLHPSGGHHRLPPRDVRGGDAPSRFFL